MKGRLFAFSLAEMLVVMLVVAIVLAISAPMITKKMAAGAGSGGGSPWNVISGGSLIYNPKGRPITSLIGANETQFVFVQKSLSKIPRLTIASKENFPHIGFVYDNKPKGFLSISNGIALGNKAIALGNNSVAIGYNVVAAKPNSVVVGKDVISMHPNSITLGNTNTLVSIPGTLVVSNLVVDNSATLSPKLIKGLFDSYLSENGSEITKMLLPSASGTQKASPEISQEMLDSLMQQLLNQQLSDRRLKDIIGENLDSLDKLERLKVYNYTFKADKQKKVRVGVLAQDLQKVFPDAVSENEKGYLQIRTEDIFYAMLNAIKELNRKSVDREQFELLSKKVEAQEKELKALRKEIESLKK